jgi:hypothetical protein
LSPRQKASSTIAVSGLRALEEAGHVEIVVGGDDRPHAGRGAVLINQATAFAAIRGDLGDWRGRLCAGHGVRTRDRLLLMAASTTQHGVEPQADEQGDHRQQYNLYVHLFSPLRHRPT